MSEMNQRSFVICGWSLDESKALEELTRIADGSTELAKIALDTGWSTNTLLNGGVGDIKVIKSFGGKVIIGRLIASGFGTNLPYTICAFDRLCSDMDELVKTFEIRLGLPGIHTGMTESTMLKSDA